MANIALDWSSAHVTADGTDLGLRVPLTRWPDPYWLREFEGLRASRHLQAHGTGWVVEPLGEENQIIAARLVPGDEAAVRAALDEMVALANVRAGEIRAEETAAKQREEEELARAKQQAAEMTERFRTLESAPVSHEPDPVEPESTFQDRLRVLSSGREPSLRDVSAGA